MPGRGGLTKPSYGPIPGPRAFQSPNRKVWMWLELVTAVRERAVARMEQGLEPETAIVGLYTKGGKDQTKLDRKRDADSLRVGLLRYFPLEKWTIRFRSIPDTWYHRQLILKFEGFMTPEQAVDYRAVRRAHFEAMMLQIQQGRQRKMIEVQAKAAIEAEAMRQQASIGRQRYPG